MKKTNMQLTSELGVQFWNDSCDLEQLSEAVEQGAVGATSNPVIVYAAVQDDPTLLDMVDRIHEEMPNASIDDITWRFVEEVGVEASKLLLPTYEATNGRLGFLSVQLSPLFYQDKETMVEKAVATASLAPNIAIKVPATELGIEAMEEITAHGINVNSTVSFTVPQAIAAAKSMERGLNRAKENGVDMQRMHPYITIMVGRLDDQLRKVKESEGIDIDPDILNYAGIAVFKRAHRLFTEKGYGATLLSAAYRTPLHWTELIGDKVIQTIPYKWWTQFNESDVVPRRSIDDAVHPEILRELYYGFEDFKKAYDLHRMAVDEFADFGPSANTLTGFQKSYDDIVAVVRERLDKVGGKSQ